jgi:hypothetical protein
MGWRYYHNGIIVLGLLVLLAGAARAEDEFLGSLQLRGGYDSNPDFSFTPGDTALAGVNAVVVAGRSTERYVAAVSGEASYTRYRETVDAPLARYRAAFDIANKDESEFSLKSTASVTSFENYNTKSLDAIERLKLRKTSGDVQPFVTAELRYSALNESNILLNRFLPQPEIFLRGTIIPGVAVKRGEWEAGVSLNLSATRYQDELDYFGFRRDNERIEPFLFLRYSKDKFSLFASLSRLYGDWHDADFSDVRKTLYDAALSYNGEPFGFELSARRTAEETTFPISPITIDTAYAGKIARKLNEKNSLAVFGRWIEKRYLDSPFRQITRSYGLQFTHDISDKLSAGFELTRSEMQPIAGPNVDGVAVIASLTQRFGGKKRAEAESSAR